MQNDEERQRSIAYESKKRNHVEERYLMHEQNLRTAKYYLPTMQFSRCLYYTSLEYILTQKHLFDRRVR
jgi:hypothetical protein